MNDRVKYDNPTSKWFKNHIGAQTTVCRCVMCGLFYKASLGHKCEIGLSKAEYHSLSDILNIW